MRILIVDDDSDHAESIAEVLATRQCDVDVAFTGEDGVAKFRKAPFDVVLMDIKMPGINGVQAFFECKKIRADAVIIMMTGYSLANLITEATQGGALGVLRKPFAMDELLALLQRITPHVSTSVN